MSVVGLGLGGVAGQGGRHRVGRRTVDRLGGGDAAGGVGEGLGLGRRGRVDLVEAVRIGAEQRRAVGAAAAGDQAPGAERGGRGLGLGRRDCAGSEPRRGQRVGGRSACSVAVMLLSVDDKVDVSVVVIVVCAVAGVGQGADVSGAVWTSSPPVTRPPGPRVSLLDSVDVSW